MSLPIFPLGPSNKGWGITKSPITSTRQLLAASGVEYRAQNWQNPRWKFGVPINVIRQYAGYTEYNTLIGFILSQAGMFNNWLYNDPFDNSVTNQPIGAGDGSQVAFPLVRTIGGYTEPVYYVNTVSAVYVNGVLKDPSTYTIIQTGNFGPDTINFNTAPGNGLSVTATFTFYFVCRFLSDSPEMVNDYDGRWSNTNLEFESLK